MSLQNKGVPLLVIVGADKGGVGKTTVTRALLDYIAKHEPNPRIFDTEPGSGVLKRFFTTAEQVDPENVVDQMKVFDGLNDSKITVLDIRAGLLSKTLKAMGSIGLFKDVPDKLNLVVMHVLENTVASLDEIGATSSALAKGGSHILVRNHVSPDGLWNRPDFFKTVDAARVVDVPHLAGPAVEAVDRKGQPFEVFVADERNSRTLRGYVREWLDATYAELDRMRG
jgi:hypothetical protein